MSYLLVKYAHVLGATVLFGTGLGIAFFMFSAVRTRDARLVLGTARIVVTADMLFTLTAALFQPLTGAWLVWQSGYEFSDFWVMMSLGLYIFVGACWVPVIFIQLEMYRIARVAVDESEWLPERFYQLYRRWFALGWPAFLGMLGLFYLMIFKPS